MSLIKKEDVIGFNAPDGNVLCVDCAESNLDKEYWDNLQEGDVLTEDQRNDNEYLFCDSCKKLI